MLYIISIFKLNYAYENNVLYCTSVLYYIILFIKETCYKLFLCTLILLLQKNILLLFYNTDVRSLMI